MKNDKNQKRKNSSTKTGFIQNCLISELSLISKNISNFIFSCYTNVIIAFLSSLIDRSKRLGQFAKEAKKEKEEKERKEKKSIHEYKREAHGEGSSHVYRERKSA